MAIDSIDKFIKALGESSKLRFFKPTLAGRAAGDITSLWKINDNSTSCQVWPAGFWLISSGATIHIIGIGLNGIVSRFLRMNYVTNRKVV